MAMRLYLLTSMFFLWDSSESYKGVFWELCDLHLNLTYTYGPNRTYGDYKSDAPFSLIKSTFQQMKILYPNPNFILINGDNVYHGDEKFREIIEKISTELQSIFPNIPILPSLGNHDVFPRNVIAPNNTWCETWFGNWKASLSLITQSEIEYFKLGCFYSYLMQSSNGSVLIIVLNSLLWYARNKLSQGSRDPLNQFKWLERQLQYAKTSDFKVFIVGHIPPGVSEYSTETIKHLQPDFNEQLLNILQNHSDIIDAGFFAHQHTDAFKIIFNSEGTPVIPIFQSPSVTPFYLREIGSVNPSVRLYHWSDQNKTRKYLQYHAKITPNNLTWSLEYTSPAIFPGLSAVHLNDLLTDFSKENSIYFDKFFNYHLSGRPHYNELCSINTLCRCRFLCAMKNVDYHQFDTCFTKCTKKLPVVLIIVLSVLGLLLILGILAVLIYKFCYKKRLVTSNEEIVDSL